MKNLFYIVFTLFGILVVLPLIHTLFGIFFSGDFFPNIQQFNPETFNLLFKSSLIAIATATIATFLGTVLAFLLYKTSLSSVNLLKALLLIPLFISPYILAVAWRDFFYLSFNNTALISSAAGTVLVLINIYSPLSVLIIGSALNNIDTQLEESGLLVTNFPKMVFKIILPLIKPAILSSFALIFIFSISEFSVPAFFGIKVFTTEIFTQFSAFYNHSLAILQSLLLILVCVLLLFTEGRYLAGASFLSMGSKGTKSKIYELGKKRNSVFAFSILYLIISVFIPFVVLFIQSFKYGTEKFIEAFNILLPTFSNSLMLAFWASVFTVLTGFVFAYYSVYKKHSILNKLSNWFLLIIFAIPSIIFGISLIKFYNRPELNFIYSSLAIVVIAYTGKFSFIAFKLIENSMQQIPKSLDEAAQITGIAYSRRIFKILIPLIMPALFAAFILSFIFNLGELAITIMLYPPGMEIMPIKVYTIMANAPQALTSSMTLIVFLISLLIISSFYLIYRKIERKYSPLFKMQ
ncbi:MAG: ABC transporter permease subunit [Bacteroidales bacterium]|nr:ABC transporter permease subunit [Bacteroidales bacterium]